MPETGLSGDHHLSWAPDGKRITFDAKWEDTPNIFTFSLDDGKPKRLSKDGTANFQPYWSPDGSRIAFASFRSGNADIWIMPAKGGPPTQLTNDKAMDHHPVWSPDGSKIAFTSDRSGNMDMYLKIRKVKTRLPIPFISQELVRDFFKTFGNGFVGEISILENSATHEKEMLYWHHGTDKLFRSNHFHYSGKDQIIMICSNCSFLCEGNEMVLKIHQLLNHKPYDHIQIKHSLSQYISEDIATYAWIPAAVDEYFRFKNDTTHFIVPGQDWLIWAGRYVAQRGDLDDAILLFQAAISIFPDSWEAYDTMSDVYVSKGDKSEAIR